MIDFKEYKDADLIEDTTGVSLLAVNNTTGDLNRIDASSIKPSTDNSVIIAEDYLDGNNYYLVYEDDNTKYIQLEDILGKIFLYKVISSSRKAVTSTPSLFPCVVYYEGDRDVYFIHNITQDSNLDYVWDEANKYFYKVNQSGSAK